MPFTKGHNLWNHPNSIKTRFQKGGAGHTIPHTEESKLLMGKNRQGKAVGKANASYIHGLTPLYHKMKSLPEYKLWQRKVLERDNFICRNCLKKGGDLTPHHLTAFSFLINVVFKIKTLQEAKECFLLWNIRNGITLCEKCHSETPNYKWRVHKTPRDRTFYLPLTALAIFIFLLLPQPTFSATFGYTSIGATLHGLALGAQQSEGLGYSPAESGTLDSITAYLKNADVSNNHNAQLGLYIYSDNSLVGNTSNIVVPLNTTNWRTGTVASTPAITVVDYLTAIQIDNGNVQIYSDDTGATTREFQNTTYGTWTNPASWTGSGIARRYSIYATYTASAAAPAPNPPNPPAIFFDGDSLNYPPAKPERFTYQLKKYGRRSY